MVTFIITIIINIVFHLDADSSLTRGKDESNLGYNTPKDSKFKKEQKFDKNGKLIKSSNKGRRERGLEAGKHLNDFQLINLRPIISQLL